MLTYEDLQMSDGPHRTLAMRRGWQQLAERVAKQAFAPHEVSEALPLALQQDWNEEISQRLGRQLRTILCEGQAPLFKDQNLEQLKALRQEAAGSPLGCTLVDCAVQSVTRGAEGETALREAAANALLDRANRGARQVEEHYRRESGEASASHVRERLDSGIAQFDIDSIAGRLVGLDEGEQLRVIPKKPGLDDGVEL
ncbi:MAG: hypothetical protein U5R46_06115 [Gammaproteobacteria bacterium]|nr:hypothetical protein [Gammaproteobacteria bacterium]